jgi:hypothetical protein
VLGVRDVAQDAEGRRAGGKGLRRGAGCQ